MMLIIKHLLINKLVFLGFHLLRLPLRPSSSSSDCYHTMYEIPIEELHIYKVIYNKLY